jgi:hypothetical protein
VIFFITFGAPDPASVLLADLGACWALVFLAIAGLFPARRPPSRRKAARVMAYRRALLATVKAGSAA